MKTLFVATITLFASSTLFASPGLKTSTENKPSISIEDARIFTPIKGSNVTGGFGRFTNLTDKEVQIEVKEASPFKALEMHETVKKGDTMAMQKIEAISIPAKQSLELKPGSYHIMLFDPSREVKADETLKVTLVVNGQSQIFDFKVVNRMPNKGHHSH